MSDPAFPYDSPPRELVAKYRLLFHIEGCLGDRVLKRAFDITISLALVAPVLLMLMVIAMCMLLEGRFDRASRGPLFVSYWSVSRGRPFLKWKVRTIKSKFIDPELASRHDWGAFTMDSHPDCCTRVGRWVKALYLDELPQVFSILTGKMSLVGPRPLAVRHYIQDIEQGNVHRKILKAGLLGPGQTLKGTEGFGSPWPEYEYVSNYLSVRPLHLLLIDIGILVRGVLVVLRVRGA
jgi:lipopolysaccharide/colanic/teichoic acid biosynthesis glycosyltransferase